MRARVRKPSVHGTSHEPSGFSQPARKMETMQTVPAIHFKTFFMAIYFKCVCVVIRGGRASPPMPGIALILYLAGFLRKRAAEIIDTSTRGSARNIFTGIPKTTAPAGGAPVPVPPNFSWDSEGVSPAFGIRSIRNINPRDSTTAAAPLRLSMLNKCSQRGKGRHGEP